MISFGERLRSARSMAGYSLQELADLLDNTVSKQALGKYEQDKMKPSPEVFMEICKVLKVRPDYFTREILVELQQVEFRKLQRSPEKEIAAVKERTKDYLERYLELEQLLGIKSEFKNPVSKKEIQSLEDIEKAAITLRENWNLGLNPINNVVEMLEEHGVKVHETEAPEEFDGLSGFANGNPVVVLNTKVNLRKLDRKRFTALHELAHLILPLPSDLEHKTKEKYCHAFAGAVLFPKSEFIKEFGSNRNHIIYKELLLLKEQWGMSVAAMIVRAKDLGLISQHTYTRFWSDFAQYKKDEPEVYKGVEKSLRFTQLLLRAVAEEVISLTKAAALNNMKLAEFRDFLFKYD
jgi:Zn-dependent peptidase ImmA (M78 family)/DNA-binding XRE family transcriptional regulator